MKEPCPRVPENRLLSSLGNGPAWCPSKPSCELEDFMQTCDPCLSTREPLPLGNHPGTVQGTRKTAQPGAAGCSCPHGGLAGQPAATSPAQLQGWVSCK